MSNTLRTLLSLFAMCLITGCHSSADRMVGNWQVQGNGSAVVYEFAQDGSAQTPGGAGKYSFGDSSRLKIQTQAATFIYKVEFAGDAMTWRDANGTLTELKRVL